MEAPTLQQVIRQHIPLPPRANARGFFSVLCKVCGDHGKKGKRAGFKFEGESVGYNCFNCGHSGGYDPAKHDSMPKNMEVVLEAFGIPETDWQAVLFRGLEMREAGMQGGKAVEFVSIEPDEIAMPPFFYPLKDDPSDDFAQYAIEYLTGRGVDWKSHPFHLVAKADHPDCTRWYGRLIIPTYKGNKLVFWQGRDLTDMHQKKYLSPNVPRNNILSGYDQIERHSEEPLYIVEGWFDAHHLKGVAVFSNKMTANQIKWISRSSRPKVVIPDRFGDGHLLARQGLDLGWAVSTPDIGSCKDVNDAIIKYGQLYTQMTILQNTSGDRFSADTQLGVYCEAGTSKGKDADKAALAKKRR
jgi:hypothetical protein